ncbi:hypothetical protein [Streptomyces sp. NPDC001508]|uniref:hypothetical protein n=1 Tax=Streptomyces sp. NPDC001508 TaxID=3154656 RepID=UPI00332D4CD0
MVQIGELGDLAGLQVDFLRQTADANRKNAHAHTVLGAEAAVLERYVPPVASEVRAWVDVLRSQGRREGEFRSWDGIRRYLAYVQPVLTPWTATGVATLRETTQQQVEDAANGLSGHARRQLAITLRSLFRSLKRQRVVFRDPARDLPSP